jgi:hypothetical protein
MQTVLWRGQQHLQIQKPWLLKLKRRKLCGPETLKRRLLVLSFGSSHTWGAGLKDPSRQAYPFLLGEPGGHVINVALRATSADYPSVCP